CEANPAAKGLYGPRVLMNLAAVAASRGQMPVAACYLDRALQVAERVPVADKSQILEVLCDQAKVYSAMNQRERFDQVVARAMKTAEERWRNDPSLATECMMTLFGFVRHRADLMRRDASPKR
ncbi:MAG: tetratricopeptide repeat protein, partial [Desulfomonilaceae bacterium]